jgi:hypothetical protein
MGLKMHSLRDNRQKNVKTIMYYHFTFASSFPLVMLVCLLMDSLFSYIFSDG